MRRDDLLSNPHRIGADAFAEAVIGALEQGLDSGRAQARGQAACDQAIAAYRTVVGELSRSQLRFWLQAYNEFANEPVEMRIFMANLAVKLDLELGGMPGKVLDLLRDKLQDFHRDHDSDLDLDKEAEEPN